MTTTSAFTPFSSAAYRSEHPYCPGGGSGGGTRTSSRRWANSFSRDELERLTVPELKSQLRSLDLKVGGRKAELVDRLILASGSTMATSATSSKRSTKSVTPRDETDDLVYDSVPNDAVVILACKS